MLDLMEQTSFKFITEQTRKQWNLKSQKTGGGEIMKTRMINHIS